MTALLEHANGTSPAVPASSWTTPIPTPAPVTPVAEQAAGSVRQASRELTAGERAAVIAVGWAVAALGMLGFANSFARVAAAAQPSFGHLAPTLPLGVDLGILVFSGLDIVLARLDMRLWWLRLIPWTLTGATVYLNVANTPGHPPLSGFDRVAHGVLPGLWVLAVEVGAHVVRKRAGLASTTRMDKVRISRWILAPASTAGLWRRMVLWEIRSYPGALRRERDRLLAKTELQDRHGAIAWRWKASRRARALYRLGELTPYTLTGGTPTGSTSTGTGPANETTSTADLDARPDSTSTQNPASPSTGGAGSKPTDRARSSSTPARESKHAAFELTSTGAGHRDFDALLVQARAVPRWRGRPSAERIRTELHIGQSTAARLAAALSAEDVASTSTAPTDASTPSTAAEEVA